MKNIKQTLILLVAINTILFTSCNENDDNINNSKSFDYEMLNNNLKNYASNFSSSFESEKNIVNSFHSYFRKSNNDNDSFLKKGESNNELTISMPQHYNSVTKSFLLEYYNEIANSYDYEILEIIQKYEYKLSSKSYDQKEQIQSILDASKIAINTIESIYQQNTTTLNKGLQAKGGGFWSCMGKTAGKKIGRGIAGGAITGAIAGAKIGAIGGTVALPGIGTATGAVGGAVFGAAKGAVSGAIVSVFWASADCLSAIQKSDGYLVIDDRFIEQEGGALIIKTSLLDLDEIKLILAP